MKFDLMTLGVKLLSFYEIRFDGIYTQLPHCTLCHYTLCALKYQRWSHIFNIFSVDMWICFALSLVLVVNTVRCISNYGHKSHLHQSKSYINIFSVTANIIAVSLSVSVSTQPRSAPLRLFFFCWVCYSIAVSSVPGVLHYIPYRTGVRETNCK